LAQAGDFFAVVQLPEARHPEIRTRYHETHKVAIANLHLIPGRANVQQKRQQDEATKK